MALRLLTIDEVKAKLGTEYPELTDGVLEMLAQEAEVFVYKHTDTYPQAQGEGEDITYVFYCDQGTLDVMQVAARWKALANCVAKILNIEGSNIEFKLAELSVSKEPATQALLKLYYMAEHQCDKYLGLISEGPKRIRGATVILPASANSTDWIYSAV